MLKKLNPELFGQSLEAKKYYRYIIKKVEYHCLQ